MPDSPPEVTEQAAATSFADALRDAVQARGLGLERIRDRLREAGTPISPATLSYWQSGRSQPERAGSLTALDTLEQILQVPPGSLRTHLREPRRRGRSRPSTTVTRSSLMPQSEAVQAALDELGVRDGDLVNRSVHDLSIFDEESGAESKIVRQVLRAEVGGARAWPIVHVLDSPAREAPRVAPLLGCTVGRVVQDDELGLLVAEMFLDRALARGDTAVAEYRVDIPSSEDESDRVERSVPRRAREVIIEKRFHPDAVPASCVGYAVVDGEETTWEIHLDDSHTAHILLTDFGPGRCGIRWVR